MKKLATILAAGLMFTFSACNNEKKEEPKPEEKPAVAAPAVAAPAAPVKLLMVRHDVKDFDKWKAGYDAHDSVRQAYGISHYHIGRGSDHPNTVMVLEKITDVQKAKDFSMSPSLKEAMQKAGVISKPVVAMAEIVRNDESPINTTDRVIVAHKVKDFDAWLKVYDAEGKDVRAANGMVDRGLARGIEDPNMVYIVFAITDKAKAHARMSSPDLKKIMTDAGVVGPPDIFAYKLVD